MDDLHQSRASWFPRVKYEVFFFALLVAIVSMLLLCLPGMQANLHGRARSLTDWITFLLDPLVLHIFGACAAGYLLFPIVSQLIHARWFAGLVSVLAPLLVLVLVLAFTETVLKPSFAYARPDGQLRLEAPVLSGWLGIDKPAAHDSCPSGSVVRQVFLFMLGLMCFPNFMQSNDPAKPASFRQWIALLFLLLTVVYVAFSRVYRGFHTVYDVGISLSVSCFTFWFAYYLFALSFKRLPKGMTSGIVSAGCILFPTYIYYSQDAQWWAIITVVAFVIIGVSRTLLEN